MYRIKSTN